MIRIVLIITCFISSLPLLFAQSQINEAIKALTQDAAMSHASVSICVLDVETGETVGNYQAKKSLTPASSMKVVTTGAALAILGEDYKFKTMLQYDGSVDEAGTLKGNLYILGQGDPTLGSSEFEAADPLDVLLPKFYEAIQKVGIKKIEGRIVGDASWLGTQGSGSTWAYEDLGNYYGAAAMGLNIHENMYFLSLQQNPKLSAPPKVKKVEPQIPNLLLMNELTSGPKDSGDNAYIFGAPNNYVCYIRGTIPLGNKAFTIKGSIPNPAFTTAHLLMNHLEKMGIQTSKHATTQMELDLEGTVKNKRNTFYTHQSPDLKTIVERTNMKSVNLYCEAMLRVLGKEKKGKGTAEAGLEVVNDFWKKKGLKLDGFYLEDGSGLSPYNAVSAYHLATVMRLIKKDAALFNSFYDSLPVAGKSGALRNRLKGTAAQGNLRAKSGGLNRVRSYTGLAKNKQGKWLSFSMIVNNYSGGSWPVLKRMERLMGAICE